MTTLTESLRRELLAARRAGDRAAAAALRSALAALDNAEAVPVARSAFDPDGTVAAAGTTEAERRHLDDAEQRALVRAEVEELEQARATYDATHPERAAAAATGICVLERVLAETG